MEVKNGIIIDGVLHEAVSCRRNISCSICSLQSCLIVGDSSTVAK